MINKIAIEGVVVNTPRFMKDKYTMIGFNVKNTFTTVNKRTNQSIEADTYFSVTMWGQNALPFEGKIKEGDNVKVSGRVKWDTYKNKEGVEKNSIGIVAEKIEVTPSVLTVEDLPF